MASDCDKPSTPGQYVGGVLLAAGCARRFGGEKAKQLVEVGGIPLVRRVALAALASSLAEVVAVLGHQQGPVRRVLGGLDLRLLENPDYAKGQSSSIQKGLATLLQTPSPRLRGVLFIPADLPFLSSGLIDRLLLAWRHEKQIVLPVDRQRRGAPVLFGRSFFGDLLALEGDVGGQVLLSRHADRIVEVAVDDPLELFDIDQHEDFLRAEAEMGRRER